jgi:Fe-S cluster biogenesis protein NfuA
VEKETKFMIKKRITALTLALLAPLLFGLLLFFAVNPSGTVQAAPIDACFVSLNANTSTDYSSFDASAIQTAVDAASAGDLLKIAGTCIGTQLKNSTWQTVKINKNLTLEGAYDQNDWVAGPQPGVYTTTLDADSSGRVVYITSGQTVVLENLVITSGYIKDDTSWTDSGGGIWSRGNLTVTNSIIEHNYAGASGGGIYQHFSGGSLSVFDSVFQFNNADGGGIAGFGGGIKNDGPDTIISRTTFYSNTAWAGGGMINYAPTLVVESSWLSNTATIGGGIQNHDSLTLINSTISGNSAEIYGGGVGHSQGSIVISHTTIVSNSALSEAGGIRFEGTLPDEPPAIANSIIAYNTAPSGDNCFLTDLIDLGYNLESGDACGFTATGTLTNTDPLLYPLADNGGPTWTHAPQSDSAIIDKIPFGTNGCGTTVTTDQRGIARPQDADADGEFLCDIGAYEDETNFELSVTPAGSGNGLVTSVPEGIYCGITCTSIFDPGTAITLTANAEVGSVFTGWSGACSGTTVCQVTMNEAKNVVATFAVDIHLLDVGLTGTGSGSVTSEPDGINCPDECSQGYNYGTVVSLTATANTGSTFTGWSGACSGTTVCQVTMNEAKNVVATFDEEEFQVYLPVIMRP